MIEEYYSEFQIHHTKYIKQIKEEQIKGEQIKGEQEILFKLITSSKLVQQISIFVLHTSSSKLEYSHISHNSEDIQLSTTQYIIIIIQTSRTE